MRFCIILILICSIPSTVFAETEQLPDHLRLYVSARGIVDALKVDGSDEATQGMKATTMQFGGGLAAGTYRRVKNVAFRFEVDYSFTARSNSYYHAIMANAYIESAYNPGLFSPYIMAGIGMNVFDPPFAVIESNFAFNVGAGVVVGINENWGIDFGFRYMQSNINFHIGEGHMKVKNHNFYIGTRYVF